MALDNTLNVEITASVDGLKSGLAQAEGSVKNFGNAANTMTGKTNKMSKSVNANAVPAMTSFSQVMQDAPYGIRGVANNIQQLTSQFGYLSAKTGGSTGALKAMIGSLMGPAGILFAVSAVTSLMVVYSDEISDFIFGTDEAARSTDKMNDALREQIGLRKLLKDELSIATSIAVAEARLTGASAEEQYSIKKKYAKANIDILETQLSESIKTSKAFYEKTKTDQGKGDEELIEQQKAYSKDSADILKSLNDAKAQLELGNLNELIRINEKKVKVEKFVADGRLANARTLFAKLTKETANYYAKGQAALNSFLNEKEQAEINSEDNRLSELLKRQNQAFSIRNSGNALEIALYAKYLEDKKNLALGYEEWKRLSEAEGYANSLKSLIEFNESVTNIINNGLKSTFASIGSSIGEALANGDNILRAAGNAILSSLGSVLIQFGELAIAAGVAALGLQAALSQPLNPAAAGLAIAAGVALIAVGALVKSFSKKVKGGGSGGASDYSGGGGSSKKYGSSSSGFGGGGSGGGTYVFEIAGTKLIGVLKNTLDRNKALGGQDNLLFG